MKQIKLALIFCTTFLMLSVHAEPYDDESKKKALEKIEANKEYTQKAIELAELTGNEVNKIHAQNVEVIYEVTAKCIVSSQSATEDDVCYIKGLKVLAEKDNPAAMHFLGNIMEQYKNYTSAIEWYTKSLASKNLPGWYKDRVEEDLERAKSKV
tara:strand:- start:2963 stop:3424 length:462 start_codon:yes stop_codon:yes gene_type:complete